MSFLLRGRCWTLIVRGLYMWWWIGWPLILSHARGWWIRLRFVIARDTARRCWNLWRIRQDRLSGCDLTNDSNVRMTGCFIRSRSRDFFLLIILTGRVRDARALATPLILT